VSTWNTKTRAEKLSILALPVLFAAVFIWQATTDSIPTAIGSVVALTLGTALVYALPNARRVVPSRVIRLVGAAMIAGGLFLIVAADTSSLWSFVAIWLAGYGGMVCGRKPKPNA
jgi:uncharacterized membrane protein YbhN (UPF0104 family)